MEAVGPEDSVDELGAAAVPGSNLPGHSGTSGKPARALLEDAARMKTEGNAFYREKNIRSAIGCYHRCLLVLRSLDSDVMKSVKGFGLDKPALTPEQDSMLRNTQVDCYNNLAACLLQRQDADYARVLEYSQRVLQWQPGNVKALYRAGVATLEMGDAKTAKQYLMQACREHPNDANVRKHLQKADDRLNQERQKEKAMCRGMLSLGLRGTSGEGFTPTSRSGDTA